MEERDYPKICKVKILHALGVIGILQLSLQVLSIYFYPTLIWKLIAVGLSLTMLLIGCFLFNNIQLSYLHLYALFSVFYSMFLFIIIFFVFLNNYNDINCMSTTTFSPISTTTFSPSCPQKFISPVFIFISIINMFLTFIQLRFCSTLRLFLDNSNQRTRNRRRYGNRTFPPRYSQSSTSQEPLPNLGKPPSYSFCIETLDVTTLEDNSATDSNELPPTLTTLP